MRRKPQPVTEMLNISTSVVTPADAAAFLNNNTDNYRNLRQAVVERYAADMREGNWRITGAPILFNGDGRLLDGQHRLHACILADTPFTTIIINNAPSDSELAIDTGLKRSVTDHLKRIGYADANNLAALLRLAWKYDAGTILHTEAPTAHQLVAYLEDHPDLEEWVNVGKRLRTATGVRQTSAGLALYLTGRLGGDETQDALSFVDQTAEGVHLEPGSPILALRKWAHRLGSATHQPSTVYQAAIVLKAVNAWRQGLPVQQLAWKRGGATNEPFPAPWKD